MKEVEISAGEWSAQDYRSSGYKKFDKVTIRGDRRAESVAVYFHQNRATFAASFEGLFFASQNYHLFVQAMRDHLKTRENLTFKRWIKVDYDRTHESVRTSISSKSWGGYRGETSTRPVSGIRLEFDVFDISEPFSAQRARGREAVETWRRLRRAGNEWEVDFEDTVLASLDDREEMFEYTDHRYDSMIAIKEALVALDARLNHLLGEDAKGRTAALLDRMEPMTLLLAPGAIDEYMKPAPTKRERRRRA